MGIAEKVFKIRAQR